MRQIVQSSPALQWRHNRPARAQDTQFLVIQKEGSTRRQVIADGVFFIFQIQYLIVCLRDKKLCILTRLLIVVRQCMSYMIVIRPGYLG